MGAGEWEQEHFDRLAALSAADFDSLVGADVSILDERGVALTVVSVTRYGGSGSAGPTDAGERPFDVFLHAAVGVDLPQGMHATDLPGIGIVPLFLVPIGPVESGQRYVASFG